MLSSTGRLTEARADHMAVLLSDGQVLLAGAQLAGGRTIASAEIYDPLTGMFRVTGGMNTSRCCASRTLLPSGDVLIAGGLHNDSSGPGVIVASAEIYHPSVAAPSPLLFSLSGDGKGQGSIWNAATGKISSTDNPAAVGDALSMYTTGLIKGGIILPRVVVDGRLAEIIFYGAAPGYPGYYQVNFRVPSGVAAGQSVPVRLTYIGRSSNAVTIGVK